MEGFVPLWRYPSRAVNLNLRFLSLIVNYSHWHPAKWGNVWPWQYANAFLTLQILFVHILPVYLCTWPGGFLPLFCCPRTILHRCAFYVQHCQGCLCEASHSHPTPLPLIFPPQLGLPCPPVATHSTWTAKALCSLWCHHSFSKRISNRRRGIVLVSETNLRMIPTPVFCSCGLPFPAEAKMSCCLGTAVFAPEARTSLQPARAEGGLQCGEHRDGDMILKAAFVIKKQFCSTWKSCHVVAVCGNTLPVGCGQDNRSRLSSVSASKLNSAGGRTPDGQSKFCLFVECHANIWKL